MTLEHMHLVPRRKATHVIQAGVTLNVNALGFAGMLLVRSDKELKALQDEGIGKILRSVGLESVHDLQVAGISVEGDQ
jgi:sulfate adenylyltransferase (ADP) / ATP adenylyltransferase